MALRGYWGSWWHNGAVEVNRPSRRRTGSKICGTTKMSRLVAWLQDSRDSRVDGHFLAHGMPDAIGVMSSACGPSRIDDSARDPGPSMRPPWGDQGLHPQWLKCPPGETRAGD